MGVSAYKSSTTRRIFTNQPFKRGMLYEDVTVNEGSSKVIVNLDISSNGDYAFPRPAFVSAVMDNFHELIEDYPTTVIKQMTSLDKTFLIGFEQTVNEEDYLNDVVTSSQALKKPFGLDIISVGRGFDEGMRRDGIFEITYIEDVIDGDTFRFTITNEDNEDEIVTVRLLGIDTPEIHGEVEPFGYAALSFVLGFFDNNSNTIGDYTILRRFIQFEPASGSVDRTSSERTLAYVLVEIEAPDTTKHVYTLTELLLKAGLGKAQIGDKYIYVDRLKEADEYAKVNELGVHLPVEEELDLEYPELPVLLNPVIKPTYPETTIEIYYDEQEVTHKVKYTVENTNDVAVTYVGTLGNVSFTGELAANATLDFIYDVYSNVEYTIAVRFYPTTLGTYNSSQWEYYELNLVLINLTEEHILQYAPLIMDEAKRGFSYSLTNGLGFPINIRLRDVNAFYNDLVDQNQEITGNYNNAAWPLFMNLTKVLTATYTTPAALGLPTSYVVEYPLEITGSAPTIEFLAQHLELDRATFKIINNNYYDARAYVIVNGTEQSFFTIVAANSEADYMVYLFPESEVYSVRFRFDNTEDPFIESSQYEAATSNLLEILMQHLNTPSLVDITTTTDSITLKMQNSNNVVADVELSFYDDSDTLLSTVRKDNIEGQANTELISFTNLNSNENYKVVTRAYTKNKEHSDSLDSNVINILTGAVSIDVTFKYTIDGTETVHSSYQISEGQDIVAPTEPNVVSHDFNYWMYASSQVTFPVTALAVDMDFIGDLSIKTYTVTFLDEDGYQIGSVQTVNHGSDATEPTAPTIDGKTHTGWTADFTNVTSNISPKATYSTNVYTVTFLSHDDQTIKVQEVGYLGSATAPTGTDVSREGYQHIGWTEDYQNVTADVTTKATYLIYTYTVRFFDADNVQIGSNQTIDHFEDATAPQHPEVEGMVFAGWEPSYKNITQDTDSYAQYASAVYTVTFIDHDNSPIGDPQTVAHGGTAVAPNDPTRENYTFTGWSASLDNITEDTTIQAQYSIDTHTVTFIAWDGSELSVQEVPHGGDASLPTAPVIEGMTFSHWQGDSHINVTEDRTLYALYEYEDIYVTFVENGGTYTGTNPLVVQWGDHLTEPANEPTRAGYLFTGWYSSSSLTTLYIFGSAGYPVENNFSLYAGWDPDPNATVSWQSTNKTTTTTDQSCDEPNDVENVKAEVSSTRSWVQLRTGSGAATDDPNFDSTATINPVNTTRPSVSNFDDGDRLYTQSSFEGTDTWVLYEATTTTTTTYKECKYD